MYEQNLSHHLCQDGLHHSYTSVPSSKSLPCLWSNPHSLLAYNINDKEEKIIFITDNCSSFIPQYILFTFFEDFFFSFTPHPVLLWRFGYLLLNSTLVPTFRALGCSKLFYRFRSYQVGLERKIGQNMDLINVQISLEKPGLQPWAIFEPDRNATMIASSFSK